MTGASVRIPVVAIGVMAAFVIAAAGDVIAKSTAPVSGGGCRKNYAQCIAKCREDNPKTLKRCTGICDMNYISCDSNKPTKGTMERTSVDVGVKQPGAGTPPKGQGVRDAGSVGVFQDPVAGGGNKLKDKVGQHIGDLGGTQQVQQSGGTSGTSTIQRSHSGKKR
jgi:hypothetical protein